MLYPLSYEGLTRSVARGRERPVERSRGRLVVGAATCLAGFALTELATALGSVALADR